MKWAKDDERMKRAEDAQGTKWVEEARDVI